jgi:hypothetical protein
MGELAVALSPLTIQSPTLVENDFGNLVTSWDAPVSVPSAGVVQPVTTSKGNKSEGRRQVTTGYRIYIPGEAPVTSRDRIVWKSLVLELDGDPEFWEDPDGSVHHTEVLTVVSRG